MSSIVPTSERFHFECTVKHNSVCQSKNWTKTDVGKDIKVKTNSVCAICDDYQYKCRNECNTVLSFNFQCSFPFPFPIFFFLSFEDKSNIKLHNIPYAVHLKKSHEICHFLHPSSFLSIDCFYLLFFLISKLFRSLNISIEYIFHFNILLNNSSHVDFNSKTY